MTRDDADSTQRHRHDDTGMGMTRQDPDLQEAARLWVMRQRDAGFDDWDGLAGWLESSPAHLAAYEQAVDTDEWTQDLFDRAAREPLASAVPSPAPRPRRRWYAVGGAIAAAVVAFAAFSLAGLDGRDEIVTAPGEQRTIPLADGSRVILNGGTRITIDRDTPRRIELASGEALFDVRHDDSAPFVVTVGKTRLLDAGTVFNVVSDNGALDVAVAEGVVIYQPHRDNIRLAPGDALSRTSEGARPVLRKTNLQAIGGWKSGKLEYSDAALDQVARDLARSLGVDIRAAPGAERLRFSGTLMVDGQSDKILERVAPLLGVRFTRDDNGWRMTPADGALPD